MKSTIVVITLCFFLITGCAGVLGKSIKTYQSEYHATVQASSDTLENLKIPVTEKISDGLKTIIKAKRPDGTSVKVEVVRIDRNQTEVSVMTGTAGFLDMRVSRQIQGFIYERLIQNATDDAGQSGDLNRKDAQASFDETTKQEIIEQDLNDSSPQETIHAESSPGPSDQIQSKHPSKLAEMVSDSVFIIYFDQNSNALSEKAREKLDQVAEIILKNPDAEITLNGYSDSFGSPSYNEMISEIRANEVKRYLIEKGLNPSKITTFGHGSQKFIATNKTKEGRRLNRRVEIEMSNIKAK